MGLFAVALLGLGLASAFATEAQAKAASPSPEFTLAIDRGIVGDFVGFGGQLNQHVYANISGPPPDLSTLDGRLYALQPQFVRIFFNQSEWSFADRMASFFRTVQLAQRAAAQINITWQGSTVPFALANMSRFADLIARVVNDDGIDPLWITLFNEPNSTRQTLSQYEQMYRLLDGYLRDRGVRDRVHFMGGDLVGTTSPLGQSQVDWFQYMATHMSDLLDAWSVHIYWNFWEPDKIERHLNTEVRTIFAAIPAELRRPLFVTEFGVRGLPTIEGENNFQPGLWPDGTLLEQTNAAAFQEAWFMIRAAQLGFSGTAKWDLDAGKYDNGTQYFSAVGLGTDGWPTRPVFNLLQLLAEATAQRFGSIVDIVAGPGVDPAKRLTAYISPVGGITILGLDTLGGLAATTSHDAVPYSIGGLPANTLFHLVVWNADGSGKNVDIGFMDSGATGTLAFSVPLDAVFALTTTPLTLPSG